MPKAIWNGVVLAESTEFEKVEENIYFPPDTLNKAYFKPSSTKTSCEWKGEASYYHLEVNGLRNNDAAWYYATPKYAARALRGYVAFWKGVEVLP